VDVDEPLVTEEAVLPNPLQELLAAQDTAGRGGQLAQQPELGERQVQLVVTPVHGAALLAEHQRSGWMPVQHRLPWCVLRGGRGGPGAGPPAQCAQPGGELLHLKRLGDVVVRTCLQCRHDGDCSGPGPACRDRVILLGV
jgi:hypothetical protein